MSPGFSIPFSDPKRQTWHDKIMHTYVGQDTPELAARPGTSSLLAEVWFWVLLVGSIALVVAAFAMGASAHRALWRGLPSGVIVTRG